MRNELINCSVWGCMWSWWTHLVVDNERKKWTNLLQFFVFFSLFFSPRNGERRPHSLSTYLFELEIYSLIFCKVLIMAFFLVVYNISFAHTITTTTVNFVWHVLESTLILELNHLMIVTVSKFFVIQYLLLCWFSVTIDNFSTLQNNHAQCTCVFENDNFVEYSSWCV